MRKIILTLSLLTILTGVAEARMYQWTDTNSGNVQLSGTPPSWYRGTHIGPRVLVFEDGELIDDTLVEVSESQRFVLRDSAFGADAGSEIVGADADEQAGKSALKAALGKAHDSGIDVDAVTGEFNQEQTAKAAQVDAPDNVAEKVAALKSLIDVWDQRQLDRARSILDLLPDDAQPQAQDE